MKDIILFVTHNNDTFNNPVLDHIFYELEKSGRKSIVLCNKNVFESRYKNVKILKLLKTTRRRRDFFLNILLSVLQFFIFGFKYRNVKTIIGIDPLGIIAAYSIRKKYYKNAPLDYFSFEMFYEEHFPKKRKEIEACKHIRYLIIQGHLREKELKRINYLKQEIPTLHIPVASISRQSNNIDAVEEFRKLHNIPAGKKLVISFGTLEDWSGAYIIADLVKKGLVPDDYIMVVHSRFPLSKERPTHKELIEVSQYSKQIILTSNYIPSFDDAALFLKQFDAGLVMYIPEIREDFNALIIGKNILHIGMSSGKFSMYMQAGLPVLAYENPTYKNLFEKYNIGYVFNSVEELHTILASNIQFDLMKKDCRQFYDVHLNNQQRIEEYLKAC